MKSEGVRGGVERAPWRGPEGGVGQLGMCQVPELRSVLGSVVVTPRAAPQVRKY